MQWALHYYTQPTVHSIQGMCNMLRCLFHVLCAYVRCTIWAPRLQLDFAHGEYYVAYSATCYVLHATDQMLSIYATIYCAPYTIHCILQAPHNIPHISTIPYLQHAILYYVLWHMFHMGSSAPLENGRSALPSPTQGDGLSSCLPCDSKHVWMSYLATPFHIQLTMYRCTWEQHSCLSTPMKSIRLISMSPHGRWHSMT